MKKLNKNGFTLVELLAVIVILAVVILVAVNNVIPQMNKAKAGAFKTEALSFLDGAEQYYTSQQMTGKDFNETNKAGEKLEGVTIKYLVDNKYVKSADIDKYEGCIKYDEVNGKFQIQLWSNSYITAKGNGNYVDASDLSDFNGEVSTSSVIQSASGTSRANYECGKLTP